jgi:hypothetical protein
MRGKMPLVSVGAVGVPLAGVTRTLLLPEKDSLRISRQRVWVQGYIEAVRNSEVVTLARAEALFILCEQLFELSRIMALPPRERLFRKMSLEL